jgi:hypothetical protein
MWSILSEILAALGLGVALALLAVKMHHIARFARRMLGLPVPPDPELDVD